MTKIFKSQEGKKLLAIYEDLTYNVTKIYDRPLLHMGMDLAFHSVLSFNFKGTRVQRGWLDILVIGDTRTGKSEIATRLVDHYKAGELIIGENTSKAGLIGGLNQHNGVWMVNWGKLPINDKRLVVLDEVSGMEDQLISDLSGIRSSGIAEIAKIRKERTLSRVRLIWISNPKGTRGLSSYTYSVQAIKDLIGRPEDIARFDYCLVAKTNDVPVEIINAFNVKKVKHIYKSDLCNKLIMWVWSRNEDQIKFTIEAEKLILKTATILGKEYSSEIPIIEPNEARIKLARICVAIACRLYSTEDGDNVIIKPEHVVLAYDFLSAIYNKLEYDTFSVVKAQSDSVKDEKTVDRILQAHGKDFVDGLLELNAIKVEDIMDYTGENYEGAASIRTVLVKNKCLKRYRNLGHIKTPAFIKLLGSWRERVSDL